MNLFGEENNSDSQISDSLSNEMLNIIWQNTDDGLCIYDECFSQFRINQIFSNLFNIAITDYHQSDSKSIFASVKEIFARISGEFQNLENSPYFTKKVTIDDRSFQLKNFKLSRKNEKNKQFYLLIVKHLTDESELKEIIKECEAKYISVFNSGLAGIALSCPQTGLFVDVNERFLQVTGYSRNEVVGANSSELGLWKNEENRMQLIEKVTVSGSIKNMEFEFRIKSGKLRIGQISSEIVPVNNRKLLLSVINDITEIRKAEHDLKTSQTQLATALEIANLGPWEYDPEKDQFTFNDYFYKIFRSSVEREGSYKMSAKEYFRRFVHPEDLPAILENFKSRGNGTDADLQGEFEHRIKYADGETGIITVKSFVEKNKAGKIVKVYGVNQDITKRKLIEQALETEKEELNVTLKNLNEGVITTNSDDLIILVNQSVSDITGWDIKELIGKSVIDFFEQMHADYSSLAGKSRISTIFGMNEDNQSMSSEALEIVSKDNEKKIIFCNTAQVKNAEGKLKGYVYVLKDITEQVNIETQLQFSQKMESIGQLAAGIAHEINTPMQYIMDNTLFLRDTFSDLTDFINESDKYILAKDSSEEFLKKRNEIDLDFLLQEIPAAISQTEAGINKVSKIIRAMKDFSHPGQNEKIMSDINLGIEVTVEICRNEWKYSSEIELNLDKSIPLVFCNSDEVNQVILNLIVNASHSIQEKAANTGSTEKGKIKISSFQKDKNVIIEVSDTGMGIPEHIKGKIFDPFFTTKEVGKGTGQGLAISHNIIVNNHNGSIIVETESGKGTTFRIKLPIEV